MKKIRENVAELVKAGAVILAAWFCLAQTRLVGSAVSDAVNRCLTVIVPSLYAMMTTAVIISKSGIMNKLPSFAGKAGKLVFGMDNTVFAGFLFSMFAGYPVGAKLLTDEYKKGNITKKYASLMLGVCYGAGPAFIFGCISGELYSSPSAGKTILISTISANVITAFLLSFYAGERSRSEKETLSERVQLNGDILTDSIVSGGISLVRICFTIMAFSVIIAMLKHFGITAAAAESLAAFSDMDNETAGGFVSAVLDITALSGLPKNNYKLLPYIAALTSFGGLCVIFQIASVVSGAFSLKPFIVIRFFASLLSFVICRSIMPFVLKGEALTVSTVNVRIHEASSPIPSLMILIMTLMLIAETEKGKS